MLPSHSLLGDDRIRVVSSFDELVSTPLDHGINALCWQRGLSGDFAEILSGLCFPKGITPVDEAKLEALRLSEAGHAARKHLLKDLQRLRSLHLEPSLDVVHGYTNEIITDPMRTDVQSFHVDSATAEADTWLCTYHGASSEGLQNDQALRRSDDPATRQKLLQHFGGNEGEAFDTWLNEHFYDLHYDPLPGATPYSFGVGNLWRIATKYPGSPVPPCIHRAPDTPPDAGPRLLLIS